MGDVTVVIKKPALDLLKLGLAFGVAELARQVVLIAGPHAPKKAEVRMVAVLDGRVIDGEGLPPRGAGQGAAAYAIFGHPSQIVETGTAAHEELPKKRGKKQALSFGGNAFAKVEHPATAGKPFINPASVEVVGRALPILRQGVRKRWKP